MICKGVSESGGGCRRPCHPAKESGRVWSLQWNKVVLNNMLVEREKRRYRTAPIKVAFAASLAALACLRPSSCHWAVGPSHLNAFPAAAYGGLPSRPHAVTIAARQMDPMLLPSSLLDKLEGLENWRSHQPLNMLLKRLNIRVAEPPSYVRGDTSSKGYAAPSRFISCVNRALMNGGTTNSKRHCGPLNTGLTWGMSEKQFKRALHRNAGELATTTSTAIDLSVRKSPCRSNSYDTTRLQAAFTTLQSMIQNPDSSLAGAVSLTELERDILIGCCHMRCLIPGIFRKIRELGAQKLPISIATKFQEALSEFKQFQHQWPFVEVKTEIVPQQDQCHVNSDTFPPKMQECFPSCLALIAHNIKKSTKFLIDLEKQKDTVEKNYIQGLTRKAVDECRDNYNRSVSSLAVKFDDFQLYNLLKSILRWAPAYMQDGMLCIETPHMPKSAESNDYQFVGNDTVSDISERIVDMRQCTTILQMLRFQWNETSLADTLEAEFVRSTERQFFALSSPSRSVATEDWNAKRFRECIMRRTSTDLSRSSAYSHSQVSKKQGTKRLEEEFRAISETFKLGFKRFLDDSSLCDFFGPLFYASTDKTLQEVGQRLGWYSNELKLACNLINERISQFIAENRKPANAEAAAANNSSYRPGQHYHKPSRSLPLNVDKLKRGTCVSSASLVSSLTGSGNATAAGRLNSRCLATEAGHTLSTETVGGLMPTFVVGNNISGVTSLKGSSATWVGKIPEASSSADPRKSVKGEHLGAHCITSETSHTSTAEANQPWIPVFVAEMNASGPTGSRSSSTTSANQISKVRNFVGAGKATIPGRSGTSCPAAEAPNRSAVGAIQNFMPIGVAGFEGPSTLKQKKSGAARFKRSGKTTTVAYFKGNRCSERVKTLLKRMLIRKQGNKTQGSSSPETRTVDWLQRYKGDFKMHPLPPHSNPPYSRVQSGTASRLSERPSSTGTAMDLSMQSNVN